jgi:hypothetical protein
MFQQLYRYDFATGKTTALATWEGKLGSIAISPKFPPTWPSMVVSIYLIQQMVPCS